MSKIFALFAAFWRKILFVWVRTQVKGASLETLGVDPNKPVTYVLQNQSFSNLLVTEQECLEAGLPPAYAPLTQAASGEKIQKHSYFFLLPRTSILGKDTQNPKPSKALVEMTEYVANNPGLDIQVVPVSIFWGRSPDKERSVLRILFSDTWAMGGRIRKLLTILILGRQTYVQFSPAVSLRQFSEDNPEPTEAVRKLTRVLRLHFRTTRAGVIGPDLSHRRTLVNSLLTQPEVQRAIQAEADTKQIKLAKAEKRARKYADEIASDISYRVIRMYDLVLTWLWNKLYNGVEVNNIEPIKQIAGESEVIYTPCHRSHIDYLLMSYLLFHEGLQMPHIAAGINLNMPVLGPILRRGGAFFMRRSFKDNPLYGAVFNEYLHAVFSRGYSVEYFVEGGRSRTGRTLAPRPGMLSMTVRSFLRDSHRPLVFVPVYFGYEKILEERTYLGELRGQEKKKESPLDIFRTLRNLGGSFGKVRVNFGEPIQLGDFLDKHQPDWRSQDYGEDFRPSWLAETVDTLAQDVVTRINQATSVNPITLVATALLSTPKLAMDEKALVQQTDLYRRLQSKMRYSDKVSIVEGSGSEHIAYVESMGLVSRIPHELGDIITLEGMNSVLMTYYRNNNIHLFAIPSLIALMFQRNEVLHQNQIIRACQTTYPYLHAELHLAWELPEIPKIVTRWIDALVGEGLLVRGGNKIKRTGTSGQHFFMLTVLADTIRQTLERFYIVISVLQKSGNGEVTSKELEARCQLIAQRMSALHGFNAPEFFDKSLFRNFISTLIKLEVLQLGEEEKLSYNQPIEEVVADAQLILNVDVRRSIRQITAARLSTTSNRVLRPDNA